MSEQEDQRQNTGASPVASSAWLCRLVAKAKRIARHWLCPHSHTFHLALGKDVRWSFQGKPMGPHNGIELVGCYVCGKVWCRDWKA